MVDRVGTGMHQLNDRLSFGGATSRFAVLFILTVAILMIGCSVKADYRSAKDASDRFHLQIDGGQYRAVYEAASNQFQVSLGREHLIGFLNEVGRRMGKCHGTAVGIAGYQLTSTGRLVLTTTTRVCANGDLRERFVWLMVDGKARLLNYKVDSPVLPTG